MEPTSRLYQCMLCHAQAIVCSTCDRGQIYCSKACAHSARLTSLEAIRARYQATFKGKLKHAACQAAYRLRVQQKVMDHGSPFTAVSASMDLLENRAQPTRVMPTLICCFCSKPVSDWLRNDFLRRRDGKKTTRVRPCAQAP